MAESINWSSLLPIWIGFISYFFYLIIIITKIIIIADQIYAHLDQKKLLGEEQKGGRKGSGGTND